MGVETPSRDTSRFGGLISPMKDNRHGQDGRATHGQDAHATNDTPAWVRFARIDATRDDKSKLLA
jgi:hypothetical protein